MFSTEAKKRQPSSLPKSAINLNKLLNNGQQPPIMASKIKNVESGFTISSQVNQRSQSNSKFRCLGNSKANASNKPTITKSKIRKSPTIRKSYIPKTSVNNILPVSRVLLTSRDNRKDNRSNQMPLQETVKNQPVQEKKREIADMAIQTNENEILNHSLIVGDLKTLVASKYVTKEIDKLRRDSEAKKRIMATRTFEQHSQQDEQHLDELKELLEKSFKTRRPHILRDNLEEDRKVIASMDELLQRERPKTESITDIKSRIKLKEQELLNLFDRFQKKRERFGKTNA